MSDPSHQAGCVTHSVDGKIGSPYEQYFEFEHGHLKARIFAMCALDHRGVRQPPCRLQVCTTGEPFLFSLLSFFYNVM